MVYKLSASEKIKNLTSEANSSNFDFFKHSKCSTEEKNRILRLLPPEIDLKAKLNTLMKLKKEKEEIKEKQREKQENAIFERIYYQTQNMKGNDRVEYHKEKIADFYYQLFGKENETERKKKRLKLLEQVFEQKAPKEVEDNITEEDISLALNLMDLKSLSIFEKPSSTSMSQLLHVAEAASPPPQTGAPTSVSKEEEETRDAGEVVNSDDDEAFVLHQEPQMVQRKRKRKLIDRRWSPKETAVLLKLLKFEEVSCVLDLVFNLKERNVPAVERKLKRLLKDKNKELGFTVRKRIEMLLSENDTGKVDAVALVGDRSRGTSESSFA